MLKNNQIIELPSSTRQKIEYRIVPVPCRDYRNGRGMFPSIYVFNTETGEQIGHTGLELYLIHHIRSSNTLSTITTAAKYWVKFLNYILHYESITGLEQVDKQILKRYADYIKLKEQGQAKYEGEEIAPDSWHRQLNEVKNCLEEYYNFNHEKAGFSYTPDSLMKSREVYDKRTGKIEKKQFTDWSEPTKPKERKIRYLPESYLELWLYEIRIHAPHLFLPTLLQAYSGLREGELVNLTWNRLHIPEGCGEIKIDLSETADHVAEHKGKTPIGHIKKFKSRTVYPSFKNEVRDAYKEHLIRVELQLRKTGKKIDPKGPIFFSKTGRPLTTDSYDKETKKIFREHFVPDLKNYCLATGQYETQKALIDAYETEFFGNHVLRHWFSMYLKVHEKLDDNQVAAWRGDENLMSYKTYMHKNHDILENFDKVVFRFQIDMFEAIRDGRAERFYKEKEND
ncbi:MAG: tyrosine-type recombinase/integrase [Fusicatenibacter sp.]